MNKKLMLALELFPPFEGFPEEALAFLKRLKKNNNRDWFAKHKLEYEKLVKLPMQIFIASLKAPMEKLAPEIEINPQRNIFRIYRDTRFSNDKTPYKTNVAAVFHLKGHWQKSAGYYVHIEPGGIYVGGGIYMPDSKQLKLIRTAIAENHKEFLSIVENNQFIKHFNTLQGEKLHRVPRSFEADDVATKFLKYKQFYTGVVWNENECLSPEFKNKVLHVYKELLLFIRFLNRALDNA